LYSDVLTTPIGLLAYVTPLGSAAARAAWSRGGGLRR